MFAIIEMKKKADAVAAQPKLCKPEKGEAVVSLEKEVSDDVIRAAVKKAGYIVVEIQ